ncbi:MAG: enoyl-CoA hydratase [Pseudomonadota bacterium]
MSKAAEQPLTDEGLVLRDDADGVTTLTLNRGAQRNCLSIGLMTALSNALSEVASEKSVRVVIIAANGPAFCSGHDLKELTSHRADADKGRAFFDTTMRLCSAIMQQIVNLPKPVIARIHGIATAAGCQLVASCDLAIAADGAKFATPGVNIGLFCSTPMVALSRNVSRKHAMEMLLTGEMISAEHAAEIGLINQVVPADTLDTTTRGLALKIAEKSALTVKIGKEAFYHQLEKPLNEAYDYASEVMVTNMLAHDAEEGIGAFIEKRHPIWEDK